MTQPAENPVEILIAEIRRRADADRSTIPRLAEFLGKSYAQTYQWVSGKNTPNGNIALKMQRFLIAKTSPHTTD